MAESRGYNPPGDPMMDASISAAERKVDDAATNRRLAPARPPPPPAGTGSAFDDPSVVSAAGDVERAEQFFASDEPAARQSFGPPQPYGPPRPYGAPPPPPPTAARNPPAAAKPSAAAAATEQRRLEGSTLDESVCTTLMRDFRHIGKKLAVVVMPFRSQATTLDLLRDWDLWGPLFVCLGLAVALCAGVDDSQRSSIFSIIFVVIWVGSAIVTINAQLLGGKISFLQSVCVLGYSVFPILVARLICMILEAFLPRIYLVRCAVVFPAMAWATKASKLFIGEVIVETRRSLAIFPVVGFYAWLGWMVVVV